MAEEERCSEESDEIKSVCVLGGENHVDQIRTSTLFVSCRFSRQQFLLPVDEIAHDEFIFLQRSLPLQPFVSKA